MRTVDERIVEMRFDNKQFESGAKQTMSTLGRLKEALKLPDTSKSLEGLSKASKSVDLKGISAGIEALEKRFSTMGIVGMRVIENITDGLMGKLTSAFNFVNNAVVSGGIRRAMNIEKAHFQLQALLKDEVKVQAVMDDAMKSVDGTAYAYDEAAKAASQFAATGLQSGEEMLRALTGITGVAAMTNSEYEGISMIFTTIAGQGRVMADQLNQLAARGLNAASTVAEWFREVQGQSEVTEAAVREMVSDGQISFKMFAEAMGWAFGESAQRANETFTGALSNVKAALARIGAGFISPLIEQNGELVQLFNALRIKINDVKSTLVFDEQTSAVSGLTKQSDLLNESVSRFVKSGKMGLEEFTNVIIGTTRSEDELVISNEILANSYQQVQDSGYATAETFAEFNSQGINAGKAVRDYMNGVLDGTIKTSKGVKDSIVEVTQGTQVMVGDIGKFANEGKISYDIFTDAIVWASGKIQTEIGLTKDIIKNMMNEVKESGSVTMETLAEFNKNNMNATDALREFMNGVENGSIRASAAVTSAVHDMTEGVMVGTDNIIELAKEGTISYEVFQAAMEHTYGDQNMTLSKRFTDFVLDQVKRITTAVNNLDVTKPMELFYYWVEITKNVLKGLMSVLKPVASAFAEVFLSANPDVILDLSAAIEEFTSHLRLSEAGSKGLHDAMKGIFDVVKLVLDIFIKLISAILPVGGMFTDLSNSMSGGILGMAGAIGRMLTSFTEMVRSSEAVKSVYRALSSAADAVGGAFGKALIHIKEFILNIAQLPVTERILNRIKGIFLSLGSGAADYLGRAANKLRDFSEAARLAIPENVQDLFAAFTNKIHDLMVEVGNIDFTKPGEAFRAFADKIKGLARVFDSADGSLSFVDKMKEFGKGFKEAFSFDEALTQIEKAKEVLGTFVDWVKDKLGPAFSSFSIGPALAGAGGIGIIYTILKLSKQLGAITKPFNALSGALGGLKDALTAYQQNLKADSILKIAEAIAVLAISLGALTFVDSNKLMIAAKSLALVSAVMLGGIALIKKFSKEGKKANDALNTFAAGLSKAMNKLAGALQIKMLGSAVKDFAIAVGIIAAAVAGLGYMYSKDAAALDAGMELVGWIALAVAGMMAAMSLLGNVAGSGMKAFASAAFGVLELCAALVLVVIALNKLFKMEFPADWEFKMKVLVAILGGLGALSVVVGIAGRIGGGNGINMGSILALTAMLIVTVGQLNKLFKMEFPPTWQDRLIVLGIIFTELAGVLLALGLATKLAGGEISAGGTLLAMCALIGSIVSALMILTIAPFDKLMSGAVALDVVLIAVAMALLGAGQISNEGAGEAVMGMAAVIGAITASLGVLAMISWPQLLKAVGFLSVVLAEIAGVFYAISKIESEAAGPVVEAMSKVIYAIAGSLTILAQQPWPNLLAAATSLSVVLVALGFVFKQLGMIAGDIKTDDIAIFLLATSMLLPVTLAIATLAIQPWEGLLAAGTALAMVVAAYGLVFSQVAKAEPDLDGMGTFLLGTLALLPIALAIYSLSDQPWEGLLAAGTAISEVLLSMSATMAVCALIGRTASTAIQGLGVLLVFVTAMTGVIAALGAILQIDGAKELLNGGIDGLIMIGTGIGEFVGAIVKGTITQISSALPQIALDLSQFMINLEPFITGSKMIDIQSVAAVGLLAAIIIALTVAEVINGIAKLLSFGKASFVDMANQLSDFMVALIPFIINSKMLKEEQMQACKYVAEMVLILTAADLLSGITKFLGVSGSISQFGEELVAFGPSIASFAEIVKDVKAEAVEGAATAAEIMATTAKKLPAQSGLAVKIFGGHSLAEFGAELLAFGPSIRAFSNIVKDVKPEAVKGAADAASIMSEVATNLPAQGGLAAKIFGEKNISVFGAELVIFGGYITKFIEEVKDVNSESIKQVAIITTIMSDLANNLPSSSSLWDKLFGGGTTSIDKFGEQLVKFGESMGNFAESVQGLDTFSMKTAIVSFKDLIDLSDYVSGASATALTDFIKSLEDAGTKGVDVFIEAFKDGKNKVAPAIRQFFSNVSNIARDEALAVGRQMDRNAGFIVDGLVKGLNNRVPSVKRAAAGLASSIDNSIRTPLKISSPSKVAIERGEQVGEGLEIGLENSMNDVEKAAEVLGSAVGRGLASSGVTTNQITGNINDSLSSFMKSTKGDFDDLQNLMTAKFIDIGDSMKQMGSILKNDLKKSLTIAYVAPEFRTAAMEIDKARANAMKAILAGGEGLREALIMSRESSIILKSLIIEDENAYWNELLAIKRAGAEAEKYQEMELEDFKKETLENAKKIYEDYIKEFETTKDRILSTFDLFTEVTEKQTKNKNELIKILDSQLKAYDEFTETIQSLYTRLEGRELLEYLKNLGVESLDQLKVINEMTDDELSNYATLYDQKLAKANEIATFQMREMKANTEQELNDIFGLMYGSVDLDELSGMYDGSIESIQKYIDDVMVPMDNFAKDIYEKTKSVEKQITDDTTALMETYTSNLGLVASGAINGSLESQRDAAKQVAKGIGENIGDGLLEGLKDTTGVDTAAINMINGIADALKTAGEIHSPSEVTKREVGIALAQGIVEGLRVEPEELKTSAKHLIEAIIDAFMDGKKELLTSVNGLMNDVIKSMFANEDEVEGGGSDMIDALISGIRMKINILMNTIKDVCIKTIDEFKRDLPGESFRIIGGGVINSLGYGLSSKRDEAIEICKDVANRIINAFHENMPPSAFKDIGENAGEGLKQGIENKIDDIAQAAIVAAKAAIDAARKELDEHSPSKEFEDIGEDVSEGFAGGIEYKVNEVGRVGKSVSEKVVGAINKILRIHSPSKVFEDIGKNVVLGFVDGIILNDSLIEDASNNMGEGLITSARNAIDKSLEFINDDLTIRPVVDLSEINKGIDYISKMFNQTFDIMPTYNQAMSAAESFQLSRNNQIDQNKPTQNDNVGVTYNFIQNNHSPKALSRVDIYRQTKNQFSSFRRAVSN